MALIKCSECGKEISDQAPACIHCGCPASKMKKEPAQSVKTGGFNGEMNSLFGEYFGGGTGVKTASTPKLKPVPAEMPEMKVFLGTFMALLDKLCGALGLGAYYGIGAQILMLLDGDFSDFRNAGLALACFAGAWLTITVQHTIEFIRAKRFIRINDYEDSIRYDSPSLTNSLNAFRLHPRRAMAKYIGRLNHVAGSVLEKAIVSAGEKKRKEKRKFLPYLGILAAVYFLLPRFSWRFLPSDLATLIVMHLATFAMLWFYTAKKGNPLDYILTTAVTFAPAFLAYFPSEPGIHILICAGAALAGVLVATRKW